MIWIAPPPSSWNRRPIHISVPDPPTNPYQLIRANPIDKRKHAPDPQRWLEHNSNNRFALTDSNNLLNSIPVYGQASTKPRAALISLVRNSELPGLMQSMRQLEHQWNRKYQYPWVFFNDEPFNDEFKVRGLFHAPPKSMTDSQPGGNTESYVGSMLLRGCTAGALVIT